MDMIKAIIAFGAIALISMIVVSSANPALIQTINDNRKYLYATVGVGTSMYPNIQNGDILVIMKKTDPNFSINIGDIIVFKYNDLVVAHRVFLIQDGRYHVKGDNNPDADTIIVTNETLIGKVVGTVSHDNPIGKAVVEAMI